MLTSNEYVPTADEFILTTMLMICGALGFTQMGMQLHGFASKMGFISDCALGNAVVDMYAKCGDLKAAVIFFHRMAHRDQVSWNTLLAAHAIHRNGDGALDLWHQMLRSDDARADAITLLLVMSACRFTTADASNFCRQLLLSMESEYGISPSSEHYAAMIDVLGYLDRFDEAEAMIKTMPFKPDATVWRSLLNSSKLQSNLCLQKQAMQQFFASQPRDPSTYILTSNLYSATGRWTCSEKVRHEMRQQGLKKIPARSWIARPDSIESFYSRDQSHPQQKDIYAGLDVLIWESMKAGYKPDTSFVLQEVEESQKKHFLFYHSAKLATAHGLLTAPAGSAVKVVKNVRLCGDCHEFMKVVSELTGREVSVRDTTGFHLFAHGKCSCGDYW